MNAATMLPQAHSPHPGWCLLTLLVYLLQLVPGKCFVC